MEQIQTAEKPLPDLALRRLIISGLAMAVPGFMDRAAAVEKLQAWYPEDQLALTALHRQISRNEAPIAA